MSDVAVEPNLAESDTDEPDVAHIVRKRDQMRGYFEGKMVEALCGKRWVPTKDYEGRPICEPCKTVARSILLSGNN